MAAFVILSGAVVSCLALQQNLVRSVVQYREALRVHGLAQEVRASYLLDPVGFQLEDQLEEPHEAYHYTILREPIPLPGLTRLDVTVWRYLGEDESADAPRKSWSISSVLSN